MQGFSQGFEDAPQKQQPQNFCQSKFSLIQVLEVHNPYNI